MICISPLWSIADLLSWIFSPTTKADSHKQPDFRNDVQQQKLEPPYNQFDFLIGEWDVDAKTYHYGEVISETKGTWKSRYSEDKKLIVDEWRNAPKASENSQYGITLRTYSDSLQRWQNIGLQSNQPTLAPTFLGQWQNNEMLLTAEVIVEQGSLQARTRFYDICDNSFEWEMTMSIDGETWHLYQTSSARRVC